jgi:hypothetical protein
MTYPRHWYSGIDASKKLRKSLRTKEEGKKPILAVKCCKKQDTIEKPKNKIIKIAEIPE